jgi:hypothetical protein
MGLLPCQAKEQPKCFIHCRRILENLGHIAVQQNNVGPLRIGLMVLATGSQGEVISRLKVFSGVRLFGTHIGVFRAGSLLGH